MRALASRVRCSTECAHQRDSGSGVGRQARSGTRAAFAPGSGYPARARLHRGQCESSEGEVRAAHVACASVTCVPHPQRHTKAIVAHVVGGKPVGGGCKVVRQLDCRDRPAGYCALVVRAPVALDEGAGAVGA